MTPKPTPATVSGARARLSPLADQYFQHVQGTVRSQGYTIAEAGEGIIRCERRLSTMRELFLLSCNPQTGRLGAVAVNTTLLPPPMMAVLRSAGVFADVMQYAHTLVLCPRIVYRDEYSDGVECEGLVCDDIEGTMFISGTHVDDEYMLRPKLEIDLAPAMAHEAGHLELRAGDSREQFERGEIDAIADEGHACQKERQAIFNVAHEYTRSGRFTPPVFATLTQQIEASVGVQAANYMVRLSAAVKVLSSGKEDHPAVKKFWSVVDGFDKLFEGVQPPRDDTSYRAFKSYAGAVIQRGCDFLYSVDLVMGNLLKIIE